MIARPSTASVRGLADPPTSSHRQAERIHGHGPARRRHIASCVDSVSLRSFRNDFGGAYHPPSSMSDMLLPVSCGFQITTSLRFVVRIYVQCPCLVNERHQQVMTELTSNPPPGHASLYFPGAASYTESVVWKCELQNPIRDQSLRRPTFFTSTS